MTVPQNLVQIHFAERYLDNSIQLLTIGLFCRSVAIVVSQTSPCPNVFQPNDIIKSASNKHCVGQMSAGQTVFDQKTCNSQKKLILLAKKHITETTGCQLTKQAVNEITVRRNDRQLSSTSQNLVQIHFAERYLDYSIQLLTIGLF